MDPSDDRGKPVTTRDPSEKVVIGEDLPSTALEESDGGKQSPVKLVLVGGLLSSPGGGSRWGLSDWEGGGPEDKTNRSGSAFSAIEPSAKVYRSWEP